MGYLIAGVLLWSFGHLFGRILPGVRSSLGDKGRGLVALAILASVYFMVTGYGASALTAERVYWGYSPVWAGINHALMLFAIYLMISSALKTVITTKIRHPQLTAVKAWAVGHLLVNGDLPSLVLFGGLLAWAAVSVILINRQSPAEPAVVTPSAAKEAGAGVLAILGYTAVAFVHIYLGYPVFPF